ncbi:MAG: DUF1353 domain-containing protein [Sulfurovum sp.]|nr:DUF1353 domain-containing protein [Sulfurovum sp.]
MSPVLRPLHGDRFELVEPFVYRDITVPAGYTTNGANVPRLFWSFLPPNRPDYLPAVVVHDYLCDKEEYEKADNYLEIYLKELNVGYITMFVMVAAVRVYHYFKYNVRRTK